MRYFPNRIIAKSIPENFDKENSGIKSCTVREVDSSERKVLENFWRQKRERVFSLNQACITIENTETWESFERVITDITFFKSYHDWEKDIYLYIISFKNERDVELWVDSDDKSDSDVATIRMLQDFRSYTPKCDIVKPLPCERCT